MFRKKRKNATIEPPEAITERSFETFFFKRLMQIISNRDQVLDAVTAFEPFRRHGGGDEPINYSRLAAGLFNDDGNLNNAFLEENDLDFDTNAPRMSIKTIEEYGFHFNSAWCDRDRILLVAIFNAIQQQATAAMLGADIMDEPDPNIMQKQIKKPQDYLQSCFSTIKLDQVNPLFNAQFVADEHFMQALYAGFPSQGFKHFCHELVEALPDYAKAVMQEDADEQPLPAKLAGDREKSKAILVLGNQYRAQVELLRNGTIRFRDAVAKVYEQAAIVYSAAKASQAGSPFQSRVATATKQFMRHCEEYYPELKPEVQPRRAVKKK